MTGRQWGILLTTIIGAVGGVFLGAGADATVGEAFNWYRIVGAVVAGASAAGAFFAQSPKQTRMYDGRK